MRSTRHALPDRSRLGAVLALMAILFPVVLIICFISVNVAYMVLLRTELRVATDAAARAAGATYSATTDEAASRTAAQQIALLNKVGDQGLVLDDADIEFGFSDQPSQGARYQFVTSGSLKNAARVNAVADSRSLFATGLFVTKTFSPHQSAIATYDNVDICLVLDRSSSMKLYTWDTAGVMSTSDSRFCDVPHEDSRWVALENAVDAFVDVLDDSIAAEHVGVVTYSSDYSLPCSPAVSVPSSRIDCQLSGDLDHTRNAMATLSSTNWGGNTEINEGIIKGRQVLTDPAHARTNARKVMIVLTDGHYTNGVDPAPEAAAAAAQGILVHSVTFGEHANQFAMQHVASSGGGSFHHAPDPETLEDVFRKLAAMSVLLTN